MRPLTAVSLRCLRARSWMQRAGELRTEDLDGRFVFRWITFNALYGQAKYRQREGSPEFPDIEAFLRLMLEWDRAAKDAILGRSDVRERIQRLFRDKFLDLDCWRKWDKAETVDRIGREGSCHPRADKRPDLVRVFARLYVLRNQIFHGCSKDGGSKNRPSLQAAVPVLEVLLEQFIRILEAHVGIVPLLEHPPFSPSQGSGGWNRPRIVESQRG